MEISVATVLSGFRARWKLFLIVLSIVWLGCGVYLQIAQTQYLAEADFYYVDRSRDESMQLSGGVATVAATLGFGTPSNSGRQIALAIIRSRQLAADFIEENKLLPILFPERWDPEAQMWKVPSDQVPTIAMGVGKLKDIQTVSDDATTGVISVEMWLPRRDIVAPLVNNFVNKADDTLRKRALQESQQSLNYLEQQLGKTSVTELRTSITDLMRRELQRITLAQISDHFAFDMIDTAVPPIRPYWPLPLLLFPIMTFLGIVAAASLSVVLDSRKAGYLP